MTAPYRCPRHGTSHGGIEACSSCADERKIWSVVRQCLTTSRQTRILVGEQGVLGSAMSALYGRYNPALVLEEIRYQLHVWPREPLAPWER